MERLFQVTQSYAAMEECGVEICHASMVPDFDMFGLPLKERNHGSDYPTRRQHRAFGQYRG